MGNSFNQQINSECVKSSFICEKMSVEERYELMTRGWLKCSTDYEKPNLDECCCRPYAMRLKADQYKVRKSHAKIIRRFENFIEGKTKKN